MPERLVRQRRGLVDLYRITSSQRAEHAAVFLFRGSHLATLGDDVPGVARDGRARRLREGLARRAGEDGEHRCWAGAASSANWLCRELFLWSGCAARWSRERLLSMLCLSRGVVKRPTKGGNAFSFASAATNASLALLPRSPPALRRTRPFPCVSQRNHTRKTHAKDGSVSCGLCPRLRLSYSSSRLCTSVARSPCTYSRL